MYVFVDHVCGMFYVVGYLEKGGGRSATDLTKISICFIRPTISLQKNRWGGAKIPNYENALKRFFLAKKIPKEDEAFTAYI